MERIRLNVRDNRICLNIKYDGIKLYVSNARIVYRGGEIYEGEHEVIPTQEEQTLETAGKVVKENISVKKIPYAEVSNEYGGKTITIGGHGFG